MQDATKIPWGLWGSGTFFVSRNPRNLRPESSSLVSTSFTHSGDDEDPGDSGIISLFFLLESPESSRRTQLQNVFILHCSLLGSCNSFISLSNPSFPSTPPTRRETKLIPVKKHCDLHRHFRPLWPYRKSETCCRGHSELYFVSCVLLAPPAAGGAAWSIGALAAALAARPTTTTPADRR